MEIVVWTYHSQTCRDLMERYSNYFVIRPLDTGGEDSLIWFDYQDETLESFWRDWISASLKNGLIYSGEVK